MSGLAQQRLQQERKAWRKDHPYGFVAKPVTDKNGTQDILLWDCVIPAKKGGLWDGAFVPMTMSFTDDYPSRAPKCVFKMVPTASGHEPLFHPNVYATGQICLDLLNGNWRPSLTIKQLLLAIQLLLEEPNNNDPAQAEPSRLFADNRLQYNRRVKQQVEQLRG
ncbi:hypothetical protein AB1Y20_009654 [Prymnesium parvum]|uniref:UBC core domain-containing protein n=1 Tax=Prymnesium parvum TaxID=97485 RepID=A0AB34K4W2_PRYPA